MADVDVNSESANPKELYGQGVRAYVLEDFDSAVRALGKASEILAKEHGDDLHDSLGNIYLYYGKSLLEVSRREDGPLGSAVLKNVEDESEEEEGVEDESETNAEEAKTNGEADSSEIKEDSTKDEQQEEATADASNSEDAKPSEEASTSTGIKEGEESEDDLTDLQLAWEVLELAKKIFTKRGEEGKKSLADTLIVLGEISLESGNFASAIEDMKEGLEIQKKIFGNDSRTMAETYFKLAGALSTNGDIDEAVEHFKASHEYLNNRLATLKNDEENKALNADEIKEITDLIPEIQEKIDDMKNLKLEVAKKMSTVVNANGNASTTNGSGEPSSSSSSSSSSKPVSNISHLVKRKRRSDESTAEKEEENLNPPKKPTP